MVHTVQTVTLMSICNQNWCELQRTSGNITVLEDNNYFFLTYLSFVMHSGVACCRPLMCFSVFPSNFSTHKGPVGSCFVILNHISRQQSVTQTHQLTWNDTFCSSKCLCLHYQILHCKFLYDLGMVFFNCRTQKIST